MSTRSTCTLPHCRSAEQCLTEKSPSVDRPYPVHGGIFREEAIMLLRKFYVQENVKAPEPKQKGTRELKTDIEPLAVSRE